MQNIDKDYVTIKPNEISESLQSKAANQLIRIPIILSIVLVVVNVAVGIYLHTIISNHTEKIYVTGYGGTYIAESNESKNRFFEVENFVKVFLKSAYGHDATTFENRVNTAVLYVSEADKNKIFDDFNKAKLHEEYVRTGASTRLEIDSMYINTKKAPYECVVYATQMVFNNNREMSKPIGFKLFVEPIERTHKNPYGLLIRDINFIHYEFAKKKEKMQETTPSDTLQLPKDTLETKK